MNPGRLQTTEIISCADGSFSVTLILGICDGINLVVLCKFRDANPLQFAKKKTPQLANPRVLLKKHLCVWVVMTCFLLPPYLIHLCNEEIVIQ